MYVYESIRVYFPFSLLINRVIAVNFSSELGGGGGVYSHIRVMPDRFLLKST